MPATSAVRPPAAESREVADLDRMPLGTPTVEWISYIIPLRMSSKRLGPAPCAEVPLFKRPRFRYVARHDDTSPDAGSDGRGPGARGRWGPHGDSRGHAP